MSSAAGESKSRAGGVGHYVNFCSNDDDDGVDDGELTRRIEDALRVVEMIPDLNAATETEINQNLVSKMTLDIGPEASSRRAVAEKRRLMEARKRQHRLQREISHKLQEINCDQESTTSVIERIGGTLENKRKSRSVPSAVPLSTKSACRTSPVQQRTTPSSSIDYPLEFTPSRQESFIKEEKRRLEDSVLRRRKHQAECVASEIYVNSDVPDIIEESMQKVDERLRQKRKDRREQERAPSIADVDGHTLDEFDSEDDESSIEYYDVEKTSGVREQGPSEESSDVNTAGAIAVGKGFRGATSIRSETEHTKRKRMYLTFEVALTCTFGFTALSIFATDNSLHVGNITLIMLAAASLFAAWLLR